MLIKIKLTGMEVEEETRVDKLRSILAQKEFSHTVLEYDRSGIPFCSHIYVPEVHPGTGKVYHEREDPGHVLKVCSIYYSMVRCVSIGN